MYASVAVARPIPHPLTYAVPAWMEDRVGLGSVVLVPLGRSGETGYVVGTSLDTELDPAKVKPISRVLDPQPAFDTRQLSFFQWIGDYYLSPLGMVIATALPSQLKARTLRVLEPTDAGVDALTLRNADRDLEPVLREVIARPGLTLKGLGRRLDGEVEAADLKRWVNALVRREWVAWEDKELKETRGVVRTATLLRSAEEILAEHRLGSRMRAVLESLERQGGTADVPALTAEQGTSARDALKRLADRGLVELGEREQRHALLDARAQGPSEPPVLNADQRAALEALCGQDAEGTWLLYGVTGSGKTEVFLHVARHVLDAGRQVLVLVPEIGLTPQLVGRFKARFGDGVAVLHSGLSGAERLSEWRRIRAGEAHVAVGARSALFAPFRDLGVVVVDEEHDDSYKQDEGVPYSARDLAAVLGMLHRATVVLATATPSLESWYNAHTGRYRLLRLPKRATPRPVPRIQVVDLTQLETPEGQPRPVFAPEVVMALRDTFRAGDQAIVLYNRRGFATMLRCTSCGASSECPNCGITMTYHRTGSVLACHYCGLRRPFEGHCPACGDVDGLEEVGKGTERIEEELASLFPEVPMARMDADTTAVRGSHQRILDRFREGETQLLVGTQIVAKGHDFPRVQTAVVVSADNGMRLPDFRAAERTYALLVQMAGRAGRGETPGRVFLQTWSPEHYVLHHLDDVERFLHVEARVRNTLRYPPFSRLVLVRLSSTDFREVRGAARALARDLRALAADYEGVDVLGAARAALAKLVGRHRWQIILRGTDRTQLRTFLRHAVPKIREAGRRKVRVGWDVDPRNLM